VLSAVLAVAVAVPVTWYVANRHAVSANAELDPVPTGPANRNELRAQLQASLPDPEVDGAVLMEMARDRETAAGLPPGRYRVHLICGRLPVQGDAVSAFVVYLRTPRQHWTIELPCPSTALTADDELDFTGLPAGAVAAGLGYDTPPIGVVLLVQFVPVDGEEDGTGD
jgi:hypothetical protein